MVAALQDMMNTLQCAVPAKPILPLQGFLSLLSMSGIFRSMLSCLFSRQIVYGVLPEGFNQEVQ